MDVKSWFILIIFILIVYSLYEYYYEHRNFFKNESKTCEKGSYIDCTEWLKGAYDYFTLSSLPNSDQVNAAVRMCKEDGSGYEEQCTVVSCSDNLVPSNLGLKNGQVSSTWEIDCSIPISISTSLDGYMNKNGTFSSTNPGNDDKVSSNYYSDRKSVV